MDGDTLIFFAWLAVVVVLFANYAWHELSGWRAGE